MKLKRDDHIVTAWAEAASGPGYSNAPLWVLIRNPIGELRVECMQPEQQSLEMLVLYSTSAAAHEAMLNAVRSHTKHYDD